MSHILNNEVLVFVVQHLGELGNNTVMRSGCGHDEAFTTGYTVGGVSLSNLPLT